MLDYCFEHHYLEKFFVFRVLINAIIANFAKEVTPKQQCYYLETVQDVMNLLGGYMILVG